MQNELIEYTTTSNIIVHTVSIISVASEKFALEWYKKCSKHTTMQEIKDMIRKWFKNHKIIISDIQSVSFNYFCL